MSKKKNDWKKGMESPNPNGRPRGRGRPVSKLRTTLRRLTEMEAEALENIQKVISGEDMNSKTIETSKWLISTIVTVNRAAIADEQLSHNVRAYNDELEEKEEAKREGTTGKVVRFKSFSVDDDEDDEE